MTDSDSSDNGSSGKARGRPAFVPTPEQRRMVQVLAAHGIGQRLLAKTVGINVKTLAKVFRGELTDGLESVKASMILTVIRAGLGGDWHAAKYWLSSHCEEWRVTERREIEHIANPLSHLSTEELEARLEELRAAGRETDRLRDRRREMEPPPGAGSVH
jgi:hypothetical protein